MESIKVRVFFSDQNNLLNVETLNDFDKNGEIKPCDSLILSDCKFADKGIAGVIGTLKSQHLEIEDLLSILSDEVRKHLGDKKTYVAKNIRYRSDLKKYVVDDREELIRSGLRADAVYEADKENYETAWDNPMMLYLEVDNEDGPAEADGVTGIAFYEKR